MRSDADDQSPIPHFSSSELQFTQLQSKASIEIPAPEPPKGIMKFPEDGKSLQAGYDFSFLLINTRMHQTFFSGGSSSSKSKDFKVYGARADECKNHPGNHKQAQLDSP